MTDEGIIIPLKDRIRQLEELEKGHQKLVGEAYRDNKLLADEVAKKNNEIEQLKKQLDNDSKNKQISDLKKQLADMGLERMQTIREKEGHYE